MFFPCPTDAGQITVINSTPFVSNAATRLSCQDATGEATPDMLHISRTFFTGTIYGLPQPPVIDGNLLDTSWDSSFGDDRYGVFQCTSDLEEGQRVIALKMYREGKYGIPKTLKTSFTL